MTDSLKTLAQLFGNENDYAPAIPTIEPTSTCRHLGPLLGRVECSCGSVDKQTDVHECRAGHGLTIPEPGANGHGGEVSACQLHNFQKPLTGKWPLPKLPSCSTCQFREPSERKTQTRHEDDPSTDEMAEACRRGVITIAIPHRATLEILECAVALWRLQSAPCRIHVVDTGTPRGVKIPGDRVTRLSHQREWTHASDCIAAACQLAQDQCDTEYLIQTHADVLPKRRDLAQWLMSQCGSETPVVGYEMSPRDHVQGKLSQMWRGMVGHSLTICHVPTLRSNRIVWDRETASKDFGLIATNNPQNWDTEVTFGLCLNRAGIVPKFIGHDRNYEKLDDEWHVHCRSYPSSVVYPNSHTPIAAAYVADELPKARQRIKDWKRLLVPADVISMIRPAVSS